LLAHSTPSAASEEEGDMRKEATSGKYNRTKNI